MPLLRRICAMRDDLVASRAARVPEIKPCRPATMRSWSTSGHGSRRPSKRVRVAEVGGPHPGIARPEHGRGRKGPALPARNPALLTPMSRSSQASAAPRPAPPRSQLTRGVWWRPKAAIGRSALCQGGPDGCFVRSVAPRRGEGFSCGRVEAVPTRGGAGGELGGRSRPAVGRPEGKG